MLTFQAVIVLTGVLTAASCALVGTFLVLRRMSMIGDAISHSVLLGIVAVFWFFGTRAAPLMVVGASLVGLLTVALIEMVRRTGRVKEDAAIGLVFPALFSVGVILVSRFPSQVHIDVQHLLYGEITFAPLYRAEVFGREWGYRSLWILGVMTALNLLFILVFYKELKLGTFDPGLAAALGFSPALINYLLMGMVSATTVVAFDSVGAILVVAMLIVPPATAYLLTDRLSVMLALSVAVGALSAMSGYWFARHVDGSIAGAMATMAGLIFAIVFLVSPRHGVAARLIRLGRMRRSFDLRLLVVHLDVRHGSDEIAALRRRFRWSARTERRVVRAASRAGLVRGPVQGRLELTDGGRAFAEEASFAPDVA